MNLSNLLAPTALVVCVWSTAAPPVRADSAKPIRTTEDALADAATVIEGRVADISFTYDPVEGPRTVATFTDVQTHLGERVDSKVRIATLGGPLPDGRILDIPELPEFRIGSSYVILLTSSDWFYSPVVANYAFRVERIGGRELLVTLTGHPIVGVSRANVEAAALSVDPPRVSMRTRFDRPVLVADAAARAITGISKTSFLGLLKEVGKATPPHGTFKRNIAKNKVWNVTTADPDPLEAVDGAAVCSPEQGAEFVCRDSGNSSSKGGDQ